MKKWVLLSLLLFSISTQAQSLPSSFTQAFKASGVPLSALGVYVQEVAPLSKNVKPIISWQADQPLQPGSTMKVVTSYAALNMLGPSYNWKTSVYMTGFIDGDVLRGNLVVQGGGDPHLVLENFWMLVQQIRAKGIRKIEGKVILDSSWMEPQYIDPAEFDGDPMRPYNVIPDALMVNYNAINLYFMPETNGLRVTSVTPLAVQSAVNVRLETAACNDWRSKITPTFRMKNQKVHVTLTGTYATSCGDKTWSLQPYPLTHAEYVGALFRALWKEAGGQFNGEIELGITPSTAELVTEISSEPLAEILYLMNKYSNNVMSRLVMLTLDKETNQQAANSKRAAQLIKDWLPSLGIDAQGFEIDNGSGLSRTERISPSQFGRLLNHAFASSVMPELMASLPVVGVDGTMKKRAKNHTVVGYGHVKTGGLKNVRGIAGYVLAASGKRYVVVCLVNDDNADASMAAQDELLQWVYANG